ncbi:MAG: sulfatase-like hydrolase/transferase [Gemmatimonadetes bacterium]|nr:sulfatase-like hydrolase/transferase [Gemmatimonadota bacterium]
MPRNVVLITSDQHRRDALGCYGNAVVHTPNLDRLAGQKNRCSAMRERLLAGWDLPTT